MTLSDSCLPLPAPAALPSSNQSRPHEYQLKAVCSPKVFFLGRTMQCFPGASGRGQPGKPQIVTLPVKL